MSGSDTPRVKRAQVEIYGWPTDTVSIDFHSSPRASTSSQSCSSSASSISSTAPPSAEVPHTVLVLIPGNPGQCDWYVPDLVSLVARLGHGFAARSVSHAGHSIGGGIVDVEDFVQRNDSSDASIPWTVDGQILHKCAYMDHLLSILDKQRRQETTACRLILMGHSFGCHVLQRMCILRPKLLRRTVSILYLMPFVRMNADKFNQAKLNLGASSPRTLISMGTTALRLLQTLPLSAVDRFANTGGIHDPKIREIAVQLLRQPTYVKNFFELGTEEIRDIPNEIDISALRVLGKHCPIFMLFAGNDQWAPAHHMKDVEQLQAENVLPKNISMAYLPELRHDYVSHDGMSSKVADWCCQSIVMTSRYPGRNVHPMFVRDDDESNVMKSKL